MIKIGRSINSVSHGFGVPCDDYKKYINAVAKKTCRVIDQDAIEMMFRFTERHPYYMNMLCTVFGGMSIKAEDAERWVN